MMGEGWIERQKRRDREERVRGRGDKLQGGSKAV